MDVRWGRQISSFIVGFLGWTSEFTFQFPPLLQSLEDHSAAHRISFFSFVIPYAAAIRVVSLQAVEKQYRHLDKVKDLSSVWKYEIPHGVYPECKERDSSRCSE